MSDDAVILELATYSNTEGFKTIKSESVIVNRLTGDAVSGHDIDDLLDAGRKVFFTFGGDPVEVVKVKFEIVENSLNKS